jgi:uncharacterized protein YjbI with pentapeptide repeats
VLISPGTNLRGARFEGAKLGLDNLAGATNLVDADLTDANFTDADLSGAKLAGAIYSAGTAFPRDFDPQQRGMKLV